MIAHMYPSVLQAVLGLGYAGCLDGCFQGYRGEAMQHPGYELPRISIPRTSVNKGIKKGRVPPLSGPSLSYGSPTSPLLARDIEGFAPNYRSEQPESVRLPSLLSAARRCWSSPGMEVGKWECYSTY